MAYLPEFDAYSNPVNPFADLGVLGQELSGKLVVAGTPDGRVGRTPPGDPDANGYRVEHEVEVGADGSVSGSTWIAVEGRPAVRLRAALAGEASPDELAGELLARSPEGGFGRIESSDPNDLNVPLRCSGTWRTDGVVSVGPDTWFTAPAGLDFVNVQKAREFLSQTERRFPVVVGAVRVTWRHRIRVPAGRSVRHPERRTVENPVGRFTSRSALEPDGWIVIDRELRIVRDVVGTEDSPHLRALLEAVIADGRAPIVLSARE
jgi:hypothetical protein